MEPTVAVPEWSRGTDMLGKANQTLDTPVVWGQRGTVSSSRPVRHARPQPKEVQARPQGGSPCVTHVAPSPSSPASPPGSSPQPRSPTRQCCPVPHLLGTSGGTPSQPHPRRAPDYRPGSLWHLWLSGFS